MEINWKPIILPAIAMLLMFITILSGCGSSTPTGTGGGGGGGTTLITAYIWNDAVLGMQYSILVQDSVTLAGASTAKVTINGTVLTDLGGIGAFSPPVGVSPVVVGGPIALSITDKGFTYTVNGTMAPAVFPTITAPLPNANLAVAAVQTVTWNAVPGAINYDAFIGGPNSGIIGTNLLNWAIPANTLVLGVGANTIEVDANFSNLPIPGAAAGSSLITQTARVVVVNGI